MSNLNDLRVPSQMEEGAYECISCHSHLFDVLLDGRCSECHLLDDIDMANPMP